MALRNHQDSEWLETDGLGGFASGTVGGIRTRRYHALLLPATTPPTGRVALVNGLDAVVATPDGEFAVSSQAYNPGVVHPDGRDRIESFDYEPWPSWVYKLGNGARIEQEIFVRHGLPITAVSWKIRGQSCKASLRVRPFISGRDYHWLLHEGPETHLGAEIKGPRVAWRPNPDLPGILCLSNGTYEHDPVWYRNFRYAREEARGLDFTEDLPSPGTFTWDLDNGRAVLIFAARTPETEDALAGDVNESFERLRRAERKRRRRFPSRLERAADAYLVRRNSGKSIIAGYPWFTDWGRDTFIALRGLCLATGRFEDAGAILGAWAGTVSQGMLPNRFPDRGEEPEYNSVDASLWFVITAFEYLAKYSREGSAPPAAEARKIRGAVRAIIEGYRNGTRYGIGLDDDGLLRAGEPGVQLTWMDAKTGDRVVTPRIGKPVEIQALWLTALRLARDMDPSWNSLFDRGLESFRRKFWNEEGGYLFDVVDSDHEPGKTDASLRPNQIFAAGGLPFRLLDREKAQRVVDEVARRLLTPLGLRTLDPDDPAYQGRYEGDVVARDEAYHQGTVWPWLLGPFVEAWVLARENSETARREARRRFLKPLREHLETAGLGHVSEIAAGDEPHTPRGCPFQAWSLGELLRLEYDVLATREDE